MKAKVTYGSDGEVEKIDASDGVNGQSIRASMDGTTAVVYSIEPEDGEPVVYGAELNQLMDYVSKLDFVQAVCLDSDERQE